MNQKLTLNPDADSPDDVAMPSDDAVRQALLRMGSGKQRPGGNGGGSGQNQHDRQHDRQAGSQHGFQHGGGQRRGGDQMQATASSPDARRRRFSQNEHVPVEYVSRDRPARNGETLRLDAGRDTQEPADDRTAFLERELERERQARSAADRLADETKAALTAARTRIAHLEIDLQEARAQRQSMIDLAQSAAQHSAAQQAEARAAAAAVASATVDDDDEFADALPVRRGRGRPRRVVLSADAEAEPEPVKWWNDD